jgi:hypothetical protein
VPSATEPVLDIAGHQEAFLVTRFILYYIGASKRGVRIRCVCRSRRTPGGLCGFSHFFLRSALLTSLLGGEAMTAKIIRMPAPPTTFWTKVQGVKVEILEVLEDNYLYSVKELARYIESDRETVSAALRELQFEHKVIPVGPRWARS